MLVKTALVQHVPETPPVAYQAPGGYCVPPYTVPTPGGAPPPSGNNGGGNGGSDDKPLQCASSVVCTRWESGGGGSQGTGSASDQGRHCVAWRIVKDC